MLGRQNAPKVAAAAKFLAFLCLLLLGYDWLYSCECVSLVRLGSLAHRSKPCLQAFDMVYVIELPRRSSLFFFPERSPNEMSSDGGFRRIY